jgi:hypothetical protein
VTDEYPIILTEKQREAIIHCTWLRRALLDAIGNPKYKEHEEMLEWIGGEFDREEFSVEAMSRELVADVEVTLGSGKGQNGTGQRKQGRQGGWWLSIIIDIEPLCG